jgi:DNA-binding NarL/FixJ family response regulator
LGRRFTGPERELIVKLVSEGLLNREIAGRLGRTEAAVRNIRYREGLKTATANQLPELTRQRDRLRGEVAQLTQRAHNWEKNIEYDFSIYYID